MEQPNGPSEPDEVVNNSQVPMEDNKTLKDAYSTKAATIFGIFQIIIGVVSFFGEIYGTYVYGDAGFLFFAVASAFLCVSGGIAIGGAQSGNKCLVVAIDHNDGQFFRAMEWLMFFFRPPLPPMVFQWF